MSINFIVKAGNQIKASGYFELVAKISYFLLIFFLFFPIRHIFFTPSSEILGQYSDFTSYSLYLSDIFLFITFLCILVSRGTNIIKYLNLKICLIPAFLFLSYMLLGTSIYDLYFTARLLIWVVAYGTTIILFSKTGLREGKFPYYFFIFAVIQGIIAISQFYIQHSVGLNKLGEHILDPAMTGIAKIVVNGTSYIRAYGTFPHPNPFSAYVFTAIFLTLFLFFRSHSTKTKVLFGFCTIFLIFTLGTTFSRASFIALAVGLLVLFGYLAFKNGFDKKLIFGALTVLAGLFITILALYPYLATRSTISDQASLERIFYTKVGWNMIKDHWMLGVGAGESVLHMQQYSPIELLPWQKQPIHNYFLLVFAELGIVGLIGLLWIILKHCWNLIKKLKFTSNNANTYPLITLLAIMLGYITLMQFDHYFYTLQQTQMLLWIIMGFVALETKNTP